MSTSTGDGITLASDGYKVRGATSTNVDVYRDGSLIATTANDGAYTDNTGNVGGGSYDHQVCEAGTSTCSNVTTTNF